MPRAEERPSRWPRRIFSHRLSSARRSLPDRSAKERRKKVLPSFRADLRWRVQGGAAIFERSKLIAHTRDSSREKRASHRELKSFTKRPFPRKRSSGSTSRAAPLRRARANATAHGRSQSAPPVTHAGARTRTPVREAPGTSRAPTRPVSGALARLNLRGTAAFLRRGETRSRDAPPRRCVPTRSTARGSLRRSVGRVARRTPLAIRRPPTSTLASRLRSATADARRSRHISKSRGR